MPARPPRRVVDLWVDGTEIAWFYECEAPTHPPPALAAALAAATAEEGAGAAAVIAAAAATAATVEPGPGEAAFCGDDSEAGEAGEEASVALVFEQQRGHAGVWCAMSHLLLPPSSPPPSPSPPSSPPPSSPPARPPGQQHARQGNIAGEEGGRGAGDAALLRSRRLAARLSPWHRAVLEAWQRGEARADFVTPVPPTLPLALALAQQQQQYQQQQ